MPSRRRRRVWPWVFTAMLLALAGIGSCTAWVVFSAGAPVGAANEFVALLDDGDLAEAYESLCPATRAGLTFEEFAADLTRTDEISDYNLASVSAAIGGNTLVSGTIELDGEPRNVTFRMTKIGDRWQVCEYDRLN